MSDPGTSPVSPLARALSLLNVGSRGSQTISPTAHYTGYVWARNEIGPPELATLEGRLMFTALAPFVRAAGTLGAPSIEDFLLARHRLMDHLLTEAIESGEVGQVVEIAAGMSPRGHEFSQRYGDGIDYIETDLPEMVRLKRDRLERIGSLGDHHRVVEVDALARSGPASLVTLCAGLDHSRGLAVITEGLLNYLAPIDVAQLWSHVATAAKTFTAGMYLSDLHLGGQYATVIETSLAAALGAFVRGRIHLHFDSPEDAVAALHQAGFADAALLRPGDFASVIPAAGRPALRGLRIVNAHV